MRALLSWLAPGTAAAFLIASCGGSGASPAESPERPSDVTDGPDSEEESSAGAQEAREQPRQCADETCFECGDGICPEGYYCDESHEPACGWLPACAAKPSCSCIKGRLGSSCSCEEREGGLFVRCE